MKKIILTSLAAFSIISASAENVLAVVPTKVTAGSEATLAVNMNNDFQVYSIGIDITLPKGMKFKGGGRSGDAWANGTTTILNTVRTEWAFDVVNKGNIIKNGDGTQTLRFGCSGSDYVDGSDGKLFDVTIVVDPTVAPGVYPIIASGVEIYDQNVTGVKLETHASYIVVGDAGDATLALEGIVPSFVNTALATETSISRLDLSAVTAVNGTFTYVDGREVVAPSPAVNADLHYAHPAANYYSLKAPFAFTPGSGVYTFNGVSGSYASFETASSVAAGDNLLVSSALDITATNAPIVSVAKEVKDNVFYVSGETIYHGNSITVNPLRGCWEGDAPAASNFRISIDGVLTGINANQIDAEAANTYDLQGRQVQNAQNGVFVVNGKKQFVK